MKDEPESGSGSPQASPEPLPDLLPEHAGDMSGIRRLALLTGAGCCFLLGVVGWLVPVVTGIPFYIAAAILLGLAVPSVAHRINSWEERLRHDRRLKLRRVLRRLTPRRHREAGS